MDMKQAMYERHIVRKYLDKPIPQECRKKIEQHTRMLNDEYGVDISLVLDNAEAFNAAIKLILAKGVRNYFILAGPESADLNERLGMAGTFNRMKMEEKAKGEKVIGIIALGFGATQGKPHKSKDPSEVATYEGEAPLWFKRGVAAALLAPTALNKQNFQIYGKGDEVSISYEPGTFAGEDLGLVKYHFKLGAGKDSFRWM